MATKQKPRKSPAGAWTPEKKWMNAAGVALSHCLKDPKRKGEVQGLLEAFLASILKNDKGDEAVTRVKSIYGKAKKKSPTAEALQELSETSRVTEMEVPEKYRTPSKKSEAAAAKRVTRAKTAKKKAAIESGPKQQVKGGERKAYSVKDLPQYLRKAGKELIESLTALYDERERLDRRIEAVDDAIQALQT